MSTIRGSTHKVSSGANGRAVHVAGDSQQSKSWTQETRYGSWTKSLHQNPRWKKRQSQ